MRENPVCKARAPHARGVNQLPFETEVGECTVWHVRRVLLTKYRHFEDCVFFMPVDRIYDDEIVPRLIRANLQAKSNLAFLHAKRIADLHNLDFEQLMAASGVFE